MNLLAINSSTRTLLRSLTRLACSFRSSSRRLSAPPPAAPVPKQEKRPRPRGDEETGLFHDYRGVQLGMTADEVRKKLGDPKDKSEEQDFFVFGESETAQIVYDKTKKVITISADFLTTGASVPTAKQVFGSRLKRKPMVRFTRCSAFQGGFWLSYNRTGGARR